jgi:endonuclease IV
MLGLVIRELPQANDIDESAIIIKKYILDNFNIKLKYFQYFYEDAFDLHKSMNYFIHMPYTVKIENSHKYLHTLNTYLGKFKNKNIIIHLKKETPNEIVEFINAYQHKFNDSLNPYNIYWEHSVGPKNKYYKFKEIQNLMITLHNKTTINNNLCLDTCHIHNMGYDLSTSDKVIEYFKPIFKLAKILKFKLLIHLNDSLDTIGSFKDRHSYIGKTIWEHSSGYRTLIQMCEEHNTPYILEVPNKNYLKGVNINLSKII